MPEAVLNFLGRMGWSMPDEREKFSLGEMIEHFDIQRVSLRSDLDQGKLRWLNGLWIRENLECGSICTKNHCLVKEQSNWTELVPHSEPCRNLL